jgi:hypothetical protein
MIEKYFQLGVRFRWQKPNNVDGPRDGRVVDSIRPTAPMTYIGLGEIVSPTLMMTHVSTIGLSMNMQIQHQWLDYTPGRTARVAMGPYDVLTGFMSGCIIARWTDRGVTYAGHVGTVEADPAVNRLVKRTFAFYMPKTTTGFNPFAAWANEAATVAQRFQPPKVPEIMALVTTRGEFYSVLMLRDGAGEWYCGGAKLVQPMSHDALKMYMLRD